MPLNQWNTNHGSYTLDVPGTKNWVVPQGVFMLFIVAFGGGGGGGGAPLQSGYTNTGGGGGGSGMAWGVFNVFPGLVIALSVGAGGAGGDGSLNVNGSAGNKTTVGSGTATWLTADGGDGGETGSSGANNAGGNGGDGTVGSGPNYVALHGLGSAGASGSSTAGGIDRYITSIQ